MLPPEPANENMALFQTRLMQLLWEESAPEKIRAALLADAALAPFHAYIEAMEDRMLVVARELAQKWGSAKPADQGD